MILGPSHITLGCPDIDAGIVSLKKLGYEVQFIDRNLPNDGSKLKFLSAPWTLHAIAYTKAQSGLPIELVSYDARQAEPLGRYIGVFNGAFGCDDPPLSGALAIMPSIVAACGPAEAGLLPGFGIPACFQYSANRAMGLTAAVLPTADLRETQRFWCSALGFCVGAESAVAGDWQRLDFASPVASWRFALVLVASRIPAAPALLDSRGMACLSFVCTDMTRDRSALLEHGAEGAGSFNTRVNGRNIIVEMLRGPDDAYIELLQLAT